MNFFEWLSGSTRSPEDIWLDEVMQKTRLGKLSWEWSILNKKYSDDQQEEIYRVFYKNVEFVLKPNEKTRIGYDRYEYRPWLNFLNYAIDGQKVNRLTEIVMKKHLNSPQDGNS